MRFVLSVFVMTVLSTLAHAQSTGPTVFVANNGNLEGSVSSFNIDTDGTPVFIDKLITGARGSTSEDNPGTNTISLDVSPNGRYLATGHATGSFSGDYVSVLEVATDGTMSIVTQLVLPQTTFAVKWVDDEYLAVLQTEVFATNELVIFRFDEGLASLTEVDRIFCGEFATSIARNPNQRILYVNESLTANVIYAFSVDLSGGVSQLQTISLGSYPLSLAVEPGGKALYAAGGISSGRHAVNMFSLDADGFMTSDANNPYTSPGNSPKGFSVHPNGSLLFVEHGTDATLWSFFLDPETAAPTSTGQHFDVGSQGTLGGSAAWGEYLFVTDESTSGDGLRGLYSLAINFETGALTPITPTPVETTGITPETVRVWDPGMMACPPDLVDDGVLDFFDVQTFLQLFAQGNLLADFTGDTLLDFFDVQQFLAEFAAGCP